MKSKLILCLALVLSGYCHAAIVYPKAPDGGQQTAYKYLEADQKPKNFLDFLGVSRIENLTIADPFGVYTYSAEFTNLLSGQFLSATECYAWRYPLMLGTNTVGTMDLNADETRGKLLKFITLQKSPSDNPMLEAAQVAEQLPQVKKQDYEFRFLNMAPILFRAVWLHGESDDIIIPLPPTFGRWNAYQPYSESEMIKLLKPEVENRLKQPPGLPD
ncbi:MAG: hypothetical protein ABSC01_07275 [Verrucomicrobiota bacterium]|jgi:hypothetical protein